MACKTNPGLIDRSVPLKEQVLITIEDPPGDGWFFSRLIYGGRNITTFAQTSGKKQLILPTGKQTIQAKWPVTIATSEQHLTNSIKTTTTYIVIEDFIEYDFVPGKEYTIKVVSKKLVIEERDGKIRNVIPMWIGGPIIYTGWMYPNSGAATFGMKEGIDIFINNKAELKITAEATAGPGVSFKPIMENVVPENGPEDGMSMCVFSLCYTTGLKTEYLFTNEFGITLGGGITGAFSGFLNAHEEYINNDGKIDYRNPDEIMPVIPYIQAQVNFRKGRTKGYPSWPFLPVSIYFNYYPILPSSKTPMFGVGLVLLDM